MVVLLVWASAVAACIIGVLVVAFPIWFGHSGLSTRRRDRVIRQIHQQFEKPAQKKVLVSELLERMASEGRPLRLNWTDDDSCPDDSWPTAIMPPVDELSP